MGIIKEFKEFVLKGNMVDLAIGVILALAFGKVVNSLVADILMPPIGILLGGFDFSALSLKLPAKGVFSPVEIKYGLFINTVISFLIVTIAIFVVIKLMNKLRIINAKEEITTKECPECCMSLPSKAKKCGHCCSILSN